MVLLRSDLKDEALIDFFLTNTKSANQVFHVGHHVELIVLSLMVAFISSWSAFYMAYANRQANSLTHRRVSLACASMVLGLGIWAMHFIGMLAMPLPQLIAYDLGLTALSILPGMLAAWLALHFMQTPNPSKARIVGGGALVGLGIAVMHYCGIAAMQMSGVLRISFSAFVISAVAG